MTAQHTPGPWRVGKDPADRHRIYGSIGRIAESIGGERKRTEANAHLIAAAPELLEALDWYATNMPASQRHHALAAIAKARGLDD